MPLGTRSKLLAQLPTCGFANVIATLASLATRGSISHDGFHLIDANNGNLTHIAQYVSPPLDLALANPSAIWPQGARQMTALLVSTLPQVDVAAVISTEGKIKFYENGIEQKWILVNE